MSVKRFDWKFNYLLRVVLAVTFIVFAGFSYKTYNDGLFSLFSLEFRNSMISILFGSVATILVIYAYALLSQFFMKE